MKLNIIPKKAFCQQSLPAFLAAATSQANATVQLTNPYTPAGADYTITAKSGISGANGSGGTSAGALVNQDFEFKGTLGVSYTPAGGKMTDFGIGLYSNGGTFSSGLQVTYHQPAIASTALVTLADFDIKSNAAFFNSQKVEASVLVYSGANTFSFNPTQVFAALTNTTGPNNNEDYWNLNFGTLLTNAGQSANTPISGFLLYADANNGEKLAVILISLPRSAGLLPFQNRAPILVAWPSSPWSSVVMRERS